MFVFFSRVTFRGCLQNLCLLSTSDVANFDLAEQNLLIHFSVRVNWTIIKLKIKKYTVFVHCTLDFLQYLNFKMRYNMRIFICNILRVYSINLHTNLNVIKKN